MEILTAWPSIVSIACRLCRLPEAEGLSVLGQKGPFYNDSSVKSIFTRVPVYGYEQQGVKSVMKQEGTISGSGQ